jgi:hypothetical protein
MTDDAKVSQHVSRKYRELGAEEPPRALDDAILAAATRSARSMRGSARPWSQRWLVPLSLAAVVMLSVTITLQMQREQPGIETPLPQAAAPRADKPAAESSSPVAEAQLKLKPEARLRSAPREAARQAAPSVAAAPPVAPASEPKPFAASQAAATTAARSDDSRGAASSVTGELARQIEERTSRDAEAAARAPQVGPIQALAKRAEAPANVQAQKADTPERELERIAELRGQGRHDEADRALVDFRKRYPDFRIPENMRERVERR